VVEAVEPPVEEPAESVSEVDSPPVAEDQKTEVVALTADELRKKAIAAVGGFTRRQLAENKEGEPCVFKRWWSLDLYELKSPDGKHVCPKGTKKTPVVNLAIAVYEARYRLAEAAELEGRPEPSEEELHHQSLIALGVVVPEPEPEQTSQATTDQTLPLAVRSHGDVHLRQHRPEHRPRQGPICYR
jgi:hypothetical protein